MLISRYIIKEVMLVTSAVMLVLLLISLTNAFVGYLADAAQGLLSLNLVLYVLLLNVPFLASFLLPLAFFFGTLLALGRLYADSEMTALAACGYGPWQLLRTLMLPILIVMTLTGLLNFYWAPHFMHEMTRTLAQAQQDLLSRLVLPGRFQATQDGRYVIYIQAFDDNTQQAKGVFIAEQGADFKEEMNVVTSQTAYQWQDHNHANYVVLENGERYFGVPGQADYQLMTFNNYGVRVSQGQADYRIRERVLSTAELRKQKTPKSIAELQWRASLTVSVMVLAMLAALLAQLKPRQGKYAKSLPAILIAIAYTNLLILAKGWVSDADHVSWIGMYWVAGLGFLAAFAWFMKRTNWVNWKKILPL